MRQALAAPEPPDAHLILLAKVAPGRRFAVLAWRPERMAICPFAGIARRRGEMGTEGEKIAIGKSV